MILAAGRWWDSSTLIGWATFVAGIGAIAVSVLLYLRGRRPGPRSELVQKLGVVKLLARDLKDAKSGNLKIIYKDSLLENPYLVSLLVESYSQKDIASTRFDAGKPLIFNFGVPIVTGLGTPSGSAAAESCLIIESTGLVKIAPHLIRKGCVIDVEVLTEGRPVLAIENPLVEVDIHQLGVDDRRTIRNGKRIRSAVLVLVSTVLAAAIAIPLVAVLAVVLAAASHHH